MDPIVSVTDKLTLFATFVGALVLFLSGLCIACTLCTLATDYLLRQAGKAEDFARFVAARRQARDLSRYSDDPDDF